MYIFVDKKISFSESATLVNWVSIFSNHIYSYICFPSEQLQVSCGLLKFFFFFFSFSRDISNSNWPSFSWWRFRYIGKFSSFRRFEFLQLGHVTLDNDSRCDLSGHTFRGRVTTSDARSILTPDSLFRVFLRHSDHFVGTPLERISTTTSAFIYDVRFALPISTISRTWQW